MGGAGRPARCRTVFPCPLPRPLPVRRSARAMRPCARRRHRRGFSASRCSTCAQASAERLPVQSSTCISQTGACGMLERRADCPRRMPPARPILVAETLPGLLYLATPPASATAGGRARSRIPSVCPPARGTGIKQGKSGRRKRRELNRPRQPTPSRSFPRTASRRQRRRPLPILSPVFSCYSPWAFGAPPPYPPR